MPILFYDSIEDDATVFFFEAIAATLDARDIYFSCLTTYRVAAGG